MKYTICSFLGDGSTNSTDETYIRVKTTVEKLIAEDGVNVFLFAGHSGFELLCLKAVTELKNKYPQIRRLYVRDEYKYIDYKLKEFVAKGRNV